MGLGRQVADAYIEVHGDLSKFRKDLEGLDDAALQKRAMEDAQTFADAWGERMQNKVQERWHSVIDALASDKAFDWDRMIGAFDSRNLDDAQTKITDFLSDMADLGKLSEDEFNKQYDAITGQIGKMKEREKAEKDFQKLLEAHGAALKDNAAWDKRNLDAAYRMNDAWNKTFEGMRKNNAIKQMEEDFGKLADVMKSADMGKFMKGFDSFDEMRARVIEVTDAMKDQRRITEGNRQLLQHYADDFIRNETEKARLARENDAADLAAKGAALTRARELREEQERFNRSLAGMMKAAEIGRLERDFRDLALAIESNDWSSVARGHRNMAEMRDRTAEVAVKMHELGRITDEDFRNISARLTDVETHARDFNVVFRETETTSRSIRDRLQESVAHLASSIARTKEWGGHAKTLAGHFSGTAAHLKGIAGLNVFGDLIREGLDFAQNVDRIALGLARTAIFAGNVTSALTAGIGGMVVVAGDLAKAANIAILAPAFLTGLGIMVGTAIAALKDMKVRLKDLKPAFQELQNSISDAFWKQAERPIRNLVDSLMPTLKEQLKNTATSMGGLFQAFADGIRKSATPAKVEGMFKKMNAAIDIAKGAMGPLTNAFITLGEHGSNYFGRFATWIKDLSTRFDDFITKASKDGRLKKWTEDAIDAFKDTGRAIGGVTEIFQGINDAAEKAGIGGLKEFADALESAADKVKSPEFQATLTTFFEGAMAGLGHIKDGVRDLGPAFESVMPSVKYVLDNLGSAAGQLISDLGTIIGDPDFQKGLRDFSQGVDAAVKKLEPALGPLSDSLGNLGTILGDQILPNIAELVTAFTVKLSPVIDDIGTQMATLATPLKDAMLGLINNVQPLLETLRDDVMPQVLPVAQSIIDSFSKIVELVSPAVDATLKEFGKFLKDDLNPALEDFNGWLDTLNGKDIGGNWKEFMDFLPKLANPTKLDFNGNWLGKPDNFIKDWENFKRPINKAFNDWLVTDVPKFNDTVNQGLEDFWTDVMNNAQTGNERKAVNPLEGFFSQFGDWLKDADRNFADFHRDFNTKANEFIDNLFNPDREGGVNDTVNQWFEDSVFKPIRDGWDDAMEGIREWWDGVKSDFQDFMSDMLGFNTKPSGGGEVSVGGGMGSMGVGGKITPEMLGLGTPESSWLDDLNTTVNQGLADFWAGVGANIASFGASIKANWDGFWNGVSTTVNTIWTNVTTWISTKVGEIRANIDGFIATVTTNWNNFWSTVNTKVQQVWATVTGWIATKVTEISTNINNFVSTVRTNWDNFWNSVNAKVTAIWSTILGWIIGKVGEIRAKIDGFIATVKTNWDNFWSNISQKVSEWWGKIVTGVQTGIANVVREAQALPGKATAAIGDTVGLLLQKGKDFAQGFINGIAGMVGDIAAAAANFVQSAIDAATNQQDSHSPSKVTLGLGKDYGDGYVLGVISKMAAAATAGGSLVDAAVSAVTDGFAKSKMYVAGADAALGLAAGLADNKSAIDGVFADILPNATTLGALKISGTGSAAGTEAVTVQHITNIAAGAIPITTPTKDPEQVASKVIDGFAGYSKF